MVYSLHANQLTYHTIPVNASYTILLAMVPCPYFCTGDMCIQNHLQMQTPALHQALPQMSRRPHQVHISTDVPLRHPAQTLNNYLPNIIFVKEESLIIANIHFDPLSHRAFLFHHNEPDIPESH